MRAINQPTLGGTNLALGACPPELATPGAPSGSLDNNDLFYLQLHYDSLNTSFGSNKEQYNGNISQITWRVRGRERQVYGFEYEWQDRLTTSSYGDQNDAGTLTVNDRFSTTYEYDLRGNIEKLTREGYYWDGSCWAQGKIDCLAYSYIQSAGKSTNRLKTVTENLSTSGKNEGFKPGAGGDYTYDSNGNMDYDPNKDMEILYNYLNLPNVVIFSGGDTIEFTYDATGIKLRKTVKQGSTVQYVQDYAAGVEYRKVGTGSKRIEVIYHNEGRYYNLNVETNNTLNWQKEYAIRDHLGNTRLMFTDKNGNNVIDITGTASTNDILQENHYYGFGLGFEGPWLMDDAGRDNPYRYNNKELNEDFGLDWYDYGARWYDAAIGRWNVVDPLAGEMPGWSTYNYAFNNPLKFIDPDGMAPDDRYYDQDGKFLYEDDQTTDNIMIVDNSALKNIYHQILELKGEDRTQFLENLYENNSTIVSEANISAEAWSTITTDILSLMDDVDVSKLYNGKVSVLNYHTDDKFNDPTNFASVANVDPKTLRETGAIKLTVYLWGGAADSELRTVSNVKNALGVHEYQAHGIKRYDDKTKTHHKAYELQMSHSSWKGTTPDFKSSQIEKYNGYKRREKN